jgi:AAA+ superfamily predicted ATPase
MSLEFTPINNNVFANTVSNDIIPNIVNKDTIPSVTNNSTYAQEFFGAACETCNGLYGQVRNLTGGDTQAYITLMALAALTTIGVTYAIASCFKKRPAPQPAPVLQEVKVDPVKEEQPKNQHEDLVKFFKAHQIKEWHLPGQSSNLPEKSFNPDVTRPKVILTPKNEDDVRVVRNQILEAKKNRSCSIPNLIFVGSPGVGKTMLAQALAEETGVGFIRIPSGVMGHFLSKGKASNVMLELIQIANDALVPVMFIFDDGDDVVSQRPKGPTAQKSIDTEAWWIKAEKSVAQVVAERKVELVNTILEEAGKNERNAGFVVTTNRPDDIDDAFRTRCTVIEFDVPDVDRRRKIIFTHIPEVFNGNKIAISYFDMNRVERMARVTEGFKGRNLVKMLQEIKSTMGDDPTDLTDELIDTSIVRFKSSLAADDKATKKAVKAQEKAKHTAEMAALAAAKAAQVAATQLPTAAAAA